MFRLIVKLMAVILVLALAGPFFIRGPGGDPLIGFNDVRQHWNKFKTRFRGDTDPLPVYRWQDDEGNWHFSDSANPDGASELIYVDPDSNVVPANDAVIGLPDESNGIDVSGNILNVLEDARESKESLEQRNEEVEKRAQEKR